MSKLRKSQNDLKHNIAEVAEHSLQMAAQEFKMTCKPKILKLKGRYLANSTLIFNRWMNDIDMCVWDHDLTEHEAVRLVKDYMIEYAHGAIGFYLDTNDQ